MLAVFAAGGALGAPAQAQEAAPPRVSANPLCDVHGEGCSAAPADWAWQRLQPRSSGYSVEVPCDAEQADRFALLLGISRAQFPPANTRACMKESAGFTATLIGYASPPADGVPADLEALMQDAPDLFTAFVRQGLGNGVPETSFKGRRALANTIERADRRSRVVIVEVGQFGIIMLSADINSGFPGTRDEADAAMERFLESLEIAA